MRLTIRTVIPLFVTVLLMAFAAALTTSFDGRADAVQNYGESQIEATAQAATVESAVEGFFTQTAEAQANIGITQTVKAAFNAALTGTADYNATVEAAFNAALTATALTQATPTPTPYPAADLEVISVLEFDLLSGPANTGAYLSPDGTRFAYSEHGSALCIYNVLGMQQRCADTRSLRDFDPDTVYWSPDGQWITFTTRSLITFRDSDIWVMNAQTGEITNLTDDGTDELGFIRPSDIPADLDLSPRWLPDGRILFLRYNRANDVTSAPNLFAVSPESGAEEHLGVLPHGNRPLLVSKIAPSSDGTQVIYPVDRIDDENAGIWMGDITGDNARRIWSLIPDDLPDELAGLYPYYGEFSPDGQYALVVGFDGRFEARFSTEFSPARFSVLDGSATGAALIDDNQYVGFAGWSPNGSTLAYVVSGEIGGETAGLYLTTTPGEPGRMVLQGDFYVPTPMQRQQMIWGVNNTILLARREDQKLVAITLGQ